MTECTRCHETLEALPREYSNLGIFWCPRCGMLIMEKDGTPTDVRMPELVRLAENLLRDAEEGSRKGRAIDILPYGSVAAVEKAIGRKP